MGSVKIVKASAGSGKTFTLAYEYVKSVIREPMQYKHTLAVTFTNKATEEMKQRIISEINTLAESNASSYMTMLIADLDLDAQTIQHRAKLARTKILHDYSHFAILTIDKFFQRIIRSFIKELGIDLNFNLELQTDSLLSRSADELIDTISSDKELRQWIFELVEENIDENKRWDIKGELIGLGKEIFSEGYRLSDTETQTRETIKNLVKTSSAKATIIERNLSDIAKESLHIIHSNNLSVSDFSGGSRSFANYFQKCALGNFESANTSVRKAIEDDSKWYSKQSPRKREIIDLIPKLKPLLERLVIEYDSNIKYLNSVKLLRSNYRNFALLNDLSIKVQDLCTKGNLMHISETNDILRRLISDNDTPFIFEKAGNYFDKFMIDEFQDTSTMQWNNFIPLLENATAQSEDMPVMLVGDIKQSIYRWRGGDWQILANKVKQQFGEITEQPLTTNYRSWKNVVEFNNAIIGKCVETDNQALNNRLEEARLNGFIDLDMQNYYRDMLQNAYDQHSQHTKPDSKGGHINITRYGINSDKEAQPPVIKRIEELQERGYKPGDIAILVRYNFQGVEIANMLLDYKSNNPQSPYCYDVVTQEALSIGASEAVCFVIATLKLAINPNDSIKKAQYNYALERAFDSELPEDDQCFLKSIRLLPPQEAFERIIVKYKLGDDKDNTAYLQALHEQIITFSSNTISDITLFLKWWDETGCSQSINTPQNANAITIISIHKAKGLEYKAVIIPYCNWSLDPSTKTILWAKGENTPFNELNRIPIKCTKKGVGESFFAPEYYKELVLSHIDNINILYVALTRAEQELHVMLPQSKSSQNVVTLISGAISTTDSTAKLGELNGKYSTKDDVEIFEFGEPKSYNEEHNVGKSKSVISIPFRTNEIGSRVRLRFPSQRYAEDGITSILSPRNYGVLMHKAFEQASNIEDIESAMDLMKRNSTITDSEADKLRHTILKALENPTIRSWFSDNWEIVRAENDIIIPGGKTRRPDRVMLKGNNAIVVDYKFGLDRSNSHHRQIREYKNLLYQMGYETVIGYIWYVSLDDIEEV